MIGLILSCFAASVVAVPSPLELALFYIKDKEFGKATRILDELEAHGDSSVAATQERVALLTETDDAEAVIPVLERYLAAHPKDASAHHQLIDRYVDAQLFNEAQRELLVLQEMEPDAKRQREIARNYSDEGDWKERAAALDTVVHRFGGTTKEYIALAELEAVSKGLPDAIATLEALKSDHPQAYTRQAAKLAKLFAELEQAHSGGVEKSSVIDGASALPEDYSFATQSDQAIDHLSASDTLPDAIATLEALKGRHPQANTGHAARLFAQLEQAHPGGAEKSSVIDDGASALAEGYSLAARSDQAIDHLSAVGAFDLAPPALETLCERDPNAWLADYIEKVGGANASKQAANVLGDCVANAGLPPAIRLAFANALVTLEEPGEMLPVLRDFAVSVGGDADLIYVSELEKYHREDELGSFVLQRVAQADLSIESKRKVALRLLTAGDKQNAEAAFRALADNEGPDGPDVKRLMQIWGPRPQPSQIDWVVNKARAAPMSERAAWMMHLIAMGDADAAIDLYNRTTSPDDRMRDARLEALGDQSKKVALGEAFDEDLAAAAANPQATGQAKRFADLCKSAREAEMQVQAERACQAWVGIAPDDSEAHRLYGLAAMAAGDAPVAASELALFHNKGVGNWETQSAAGEAALDLDRKGEAQSLFAAALESLDRDRVQGATGEIARAHLLFRLGRVDEADQLFAKLAAERPNDLDLRADWADFVLDAHKPHRAYFIAASGLRSRRQ